MTGAIVLFVGSPALAETRGGTHQSYNWGYGALHQYLLERHASLVVCDGSAGPGDLAVQAARSLDLQWRQYHADGWVYTERAKDHLFAVTRWRDHGLIAASFIDRGRAILEYLSQQGRTRPVSVLALNAPWATPVESSPGDALLMQVVHEGFELTDMVCPESFGRLRVANG